MIVSRVRIQKFRGIREADIELSKVTALVGQNSAGKSSILLALNAFFNFEEERAAFENLTHSHGARTQAVIEVTLEGLPKSSPLSHLAQNGELRARLKYRKSPVWEVLRGTTWEGRPQIANELGQHIQFVLIPIRRDHSIAHDPETGLLAKAIDGWIKRPRKRDKWSPKVADVAEALRRETLAELSDELGKISPTRNRARFELRQTRTPDYRVLMQHLQLSVEEGGQATALAECGSGTQSMAVFALYSFLAQLQGVTYMLGFEEPEQNLHPQAQQQLMKGLQQLGLQVVCTTHSPTIVDSLEHEQVVLCRRSAGRARPLEIVTTQITRDFFSAHGLDRDKYYKFHRRRNSDFLFADFIIITESPIDALVVSRVLQDSGCDVEDLGATVVALDGVKSIPYMFHLLRALDLPHAFIVDKDYFVHYRGATRDEHVEKDGYPQYRAELKNDSVIATLYPDEVGRQRLASQLVDSHDEAAKALMRNGFFCFRYSMELDLIRSSGARKRFFSYLHVPTKQQSVPVLLTNYKGKIKAQECLLAVVEGLPPQSLPRSYSRLRTELPKRIRAATTSKTLLT